MLRVDDIPTIPTAMMKPNSATIDVWQLVGLLHGPLVRLKASDNLVTTANRLSSRAQTLIPPVHDPNRVCDGPVIRALPSTHTADAHGAA